MYEQEETKYDREIPPRQPSEPDMGWKAPTYLEQELHGRTGSSTP